MKLTGISLVSLLLVAPVVTMIAAGQSMPTTNIQGHVSDPFGFPIAGAKVKFVSENRTRQLELIADKQGAYSSNNLPAGEYKVSVSSLGFATEERNIRVWDGDQVILDVGLNAGGADLAPIEVSGTVRRQPDNAPLEGATITVANAFNQRLVQKLRTDKHGHYTVSVDNPGQYIISASRAGFMVSAVVKVLPATLPRKQFEVNFILTLLRLP